MKKIGLINGNSPKKLINAELYGAEIMIFDLNETVEKEKKDEARILLKEAFEFFYYEKIKTIVFVNSLDGCNGLEDLECLKHNLPSMLIVPAPSLDKVMKLEEKIISLVGDVDLIYALDTEKTVYDAEKLADLSSNIKGFYLDEEKVLMDLEVGEAASQQIVEFAKNKLLFYCKSEKYMLINSKEVVRY
ncbi:hypothetical protein I6U48_27625 [Clostridium sp. PL3]|uniref:HpcH/HpaI aldolase/citrate lyase domain-containing protein n=1 Tax=Clostridium thailandense TaxID=2794346 RepID=A0A949TUC9_9CLOT|nr:aldolase/citrate lyase family protein [Clostridium thailandense]MBV7276647.1 hypothetical protein [Clostridium thailandense]